MKRISLLACLLGAASSARAAPILSLATAEPAVAQGETLDVHVVGTDATELNLAQIELELPPGVSVADGGDVVSGAFFAGHAHTTLYSPPLTSFIVGLDDLSEELSGGGTLATFTLTVAPDAPLGPAVVMLDAAHTFISDGNDAPGRQEVPYQTAGPLELVIVPEPGTAAWMLLVGIVWSNRRLRLRVDHP